MFETDGFTNQHWEVIANGVSAAGIEAKDLWETALLYFQWCDANPIKKPELVRSGEKSGTIYHVPIPRPYTISGLCLQLGITREYLYDCAKSKNQNEFYIVATKIIDIIYTQKLEYSITGVFNPIISAKELGLNDNKLPDKGSPIIQIEVLEGPKLLTDERDIELPQDKI